MRNKEFKKPLDSGTINFADTKTAIYCVIEKPLFKMTDEELIKNCCEMVEYFISQFQVEPNHFLLYPEDKNNLIQQKRLELVSSSMSNNNIFHIESSFLCSTESPSPIFLRYILSDDNNVIYVDINKLERN